MNGAEIKAIRKSIGAALGRNFSQSDLGDMIGATSRSVRKWESADSLGGSIAPLMTYIQQGLLDEAMQSVIPEFLIGDAAPGTVAISGHDGPMELIVRLHWPRFVGVISHPIEIDDEAIEYVLTAGGTMIYVPLWIDEPIDRDKWLGRAAAFVEIDDQDLGVGL